MKILFLNFEVKNYHSIGEVINIDFGIAASQRLGAFADLGELTVNKIACLIGPNASGKSNILRGIVSFLDYMCHSYARPELRKMLFIQHFCCASNPTEFRVEFVEDNDRYEYAISLLNDVVQREYLKRYNPKTKRYNSIFVREHNEVKRLSMDVNDSDIHRLTEDISLFSLLLWSNYWGKDGFFRLKNMLTNVKFELGFAFVNPFERIAHMAKQLRLDKSLRRLNPLVQPPASQFIPALSPRRQFLRRIA